MHRMKKIFSNNFVLALFSGLLLIPGWYEWGSGIVAMVAFVPLLWLIEKMVIQKNGGRRVFLLSTLAFLVWNLATTWWVKNASFPGMLAAVFVSTFFMSIPMWLTYKVRTAWGIRAGLFAFVVFWIAFEFAYLHGEISWPWLTLGHAFAYEVKLIQWYELTGVLGGSLWILLLNVLVFSAIQQSTLQKVKSKNYTIAAVLVFILPLLVSLVWYYNYDEEENPHRIVVVQPNMDPYLKFNDIAPIEHAMVQIQEAVKHIDGETDFVVTPETSLLGNFWIGEFEQVEDVQLIRQLLTQYPQCNYVAGIVCRKQYGPGDIIPTTARPLAQQGFYYDYFNSAILVDTTREIQIYHKSQLVTGIEKMPYSNQLKFLKKIMLNLGGTFRSNATQPERSVLLTKNDSIRIAPVICWESVFGEYVTDYVKLGANYIFVITNDGWWGNTPGHRQHNSLSSIRAIETRRSIARSANTGISSFINQRGDVLQQLGWWKRGALVDTLNANDKITFYVRYGDYLGRMAFFTGILLVVLLLSFRMKAWLGLDNKKS